MSESSIRLGSFNLFSGRSAAGRATDPDQITSAIASLDVDVLGVQEVDRFQARSADVDQVRLIADAINATDHRFAEAAQGNFSGYDWSPGSPLDPDRAGPGEPRPGYGIALFSRRPVARWSELRLAPLPGKWPTVTTAPTRLQLGADREPRVALAAVLDDPQITVVTTHLSFLLPASVVQLLRLTRWLRTLPAPCVLVGDLNLPMLVARGLTRLHPLVEAPTYPAAEPSVQLDHLLTTLTPRDLRSTSDVLQLPVSDHRALLAELSWRSQAIGSRS